MQKLNFKKNYKNLVTQLKTPQEELNPEAFTKLKEELEAKKIDFKKAKDDNRKADNRAKSSMDDVSKVAAPQENIFSGIS